MASAWGESTACGTTQNGAPLGPRLPMLGCPHSVRKILGHHFADEPLFPRTVSKPRLHSVLPCRCDDPCRGPTKGSAGCCPKREAPHCVAAMGGSLDSTRVC